MNWFQGTLLFLSLFFAGSIGDLRAETELADEIPKEQPEAPSTEEERKDLEEKELSEMEAEAEEEAEAKKKEAPTDERIQIFGWKEWVKVGTQADVMRAKLDSGARTSSLHAENIEEFERDGDKWVRFSVKNPRKENAKSVLVKAPVQRIAKVKNTDGSIERRYVVKLSFSIGERQLREEFTLNDRTGLTCPILIGRNALRHLGFVDCSRVDLAPQKAYK